MRIHLGCGPPRDCRERFGVARTNGEVQFARGGRSDSDELEPRTEVLADPAGLQHETHTSL
jgi:hypothetical protein